MDTSGLLRWRHVIINTHSSWLHGSPKGFRTREHRIHSSGDYKTPPPPGEHEGLLRYHEARASAKVVIPHELRGIIGASLVDYFGDQEFALRALSVADLHSHFVIDLPEDLERVKAVVGSAKEKASRLANTHIPGFRWAAGGTYKFVNDSEHLFSATDYVLFRQGPSAWTWCPECGEPNLDCNWRCPHKPK